MVAEDDLYEPVRWIAGAVGLKGVLLDIYSLGPDCEEPFRMMAKVSTEHGVFDEHVKNLEPAKQPG